MNRLDMFTVKVAGSLSDLQAEIQKRKREREKSQNIRNALNRSRPKSRREKQVEQLAGKQYTGGQLARGGAIGAGMGGIGHLIGSSIEGGRKGLAGALKNPRQIASSAMRGALVGAVVPALKRNADVRAAEGGWY